MVAFLCVSVRSLLPFSSMSLSQYGILDGVLGEPLVVQCRAARLTLREAEIKMSAEDFEVTEVDLDGRLVGGQDYQHPAAPPSQNSTLVGCPGLPRFPPWGNATSGISETTVEDLLGCEGAQLAEGIRSFAARMLDHADTYTELRALWEESPSCSLHQRELLASLDENLPRCEGTDELRPTFVVGAFPTKEWRSFVRGTLRYQFPHLDAAVLPQSEIVVLYPCTERYAEDASILVGGLETVGFVIRAALHGSPLGTLCPPPNTIRAVPSHTAVRFVPGCSERDRDAFWKRFPSTYGLRPELTDNGSHVLIVFEPSAGGKREREEEQMYTHMVAHATNMDYMEMSDIIGQGLSLLSRGVVHGGKVSIAGIKDKRAVTHQRVSVRGDFATILKGQREVRLVDDRSVAANPRRLSLTHIQQRAYPISLGQLTGNAFTIKVALRFDGAASEDVNDAVRGALEARIKSAAERGFPNFFGLQRFNKQAPFSAQLPESHRHSGVFMLRGDWIAAVDAVLFGVGGATFDTFEALKEELQRTWDADTVLRRAPSGMRDWTAVLGRLSTALKRSGGMPPGDINEARSHSRRWADACFNGADDAALPAAPPSYFKWFAVCRDALASLPFSLLQLWMHSAQSLVFNLTLSHLLASGDGALPPKVPLIPATPIASLGPAEGSVCGLDHFVRDLAEDDALRSALTAALTCPGCPILSTKEVYPPPGAPLPTKVCGVPLKRSDRASTVVPSSGVTVGVVSSHMGSNGCTTAEATLTFDLPSSCYATVFLATILGVMPDG